ncbi:MAG: tRNA 2-thiouridine(34) synthase MnmA [Fibrobacterales bacterium]
MVPKNKTVAVGLSGGVDSSLVAALLKHQGYNVIGLTMEIYDGAIKIQETEKHACYGPGEEEDIELSTELCKNLDIPYHVFDLAKEYEATVLDYFKAEYLVGRTPNPCVVCNHALKFGFLVDRAKEAGIEFDYFATGHYAQLEEKDGEVFLKKAKDSTKDQTYFLSGLPKKQLKQVMFPLGEFTKHEVREMARDFKLNTAERAESQDFVSGGDYSPIFEKETIEPGNIVDADGNILGQHKGIIHYTIGQRKGLGISAKVPMYVAKIDATTNEIIVTPNEGLFSDGLIASEINYLAVDSLTEPYEVGVKIRLSITESSATISPLENGDIQCEFDVAQRSVTPGQVVVFYDGDIVFASGVIKEAYSKAEV